MTVHAKIDANTGLYAVYDEHRQGLADANRFLRAVDLRGLSLRTVRAYAHDLVAFYRWLAASGTAFADLRESDLFEYIAAQREQNAKPRSINRRLTVARLFFRFITGCEISGGAGTSSPSGYFRGPGRDKNLGLFKLKRIQPRLRLRVKVPRSVVEPLSRKQVKRFLRSVRRYRDLAIVYLMLLCGLRSREVLSLSLGDVDFVEHRVRVRGKGDKERMLPLPPVLLDILRNYMCLERLEESRGDQLFVVLQGPSRGGPLTPEGLRKLFRRRRQQPLLAPANPHRFRHTFGTDMARAGVRLPVLQKMMGHAHAETTTQYINISLADVADEYRRAIGRIQRSYKE